MKLHHCTTTDLLLKRRSLKRKYLLASNLIDLRIAVLGGSTTSEVVDLWELHLLSQGFRPTFHQTDYARYYSDAVVSPEEIVNFSPDLIYIHTSVRNIEAFPSVQSSEDEMSKHLSLEMDRFRQIWNSLDQRVGCQIIQNNFELPSWSALGNLDAVHPGGRCRFVTELNLEFVREASNRSRLLLQDVHSISARLGLDHWFDQNRWFNYKIAQSVEGSLAIAQSLTAMVNAMYGRSRKCLVLDLDNTLWGGVIGDDGPDGIRIGRETPLAEAFTTFQEYCLLQRERGILLAVCSKNTDEIARQGFEHRDSVLKLEHFSAFRANWSPKHENLVEIARELNLSIDSLVFVDDNGAERALVAAQLPDVAVPEVGDDVSNFISVLQAERYFEPGSIAREDLERARFYENNSQRASTQHQFASYGEYLDFLEMRAEIDSFKPVYMERIAQLTNKTNQFNLTTRRYTLAEVEAAAADQSSICLYGRLSDRFGDNGLVSVALGTRNGEQLDLHLWLMSCRVLKRDMEVAMLDVLVERARAVGIRRINGRYIPTKKNGMVAKHYGALGFTLLSDDPLTRETIWTLDLATHQSRNLHILITGSNGG